MIKSERELSYESWYHDEINGTYDMPATIKLITIDGKVYTGNSKDIFLTAIKTKDGYYLTFRNAYFVDKLLDDELIFIINNMLKINNMNINRKNKNILNGKKFKKEILDIDDNHKLMNTYLFVFIYYWFTDLPIEYIDHFLKGSFKRKGIVTKNLKVADGMSFTNENQNYEYIKVRDDENIIYQDFKNWLNIKYKENILDFKYFINNESLTYTINKKGEKSYNIDNNLCITENPDPNLVVINQEDLKAMPYKEYLQTQHWINTREMALIRANYECQLCRSEYRLQVHHNTYKNIGNEKDEDLIVLCEKCHKKHHGKKYK